MQNRYAGDVGDFGKIGMLRCLENSGLNIGVNWYLVEDESHNNDGKHIGYTKDNKYNGCDDELLAALDGMNQQNKRSVSGIEELHLLKTEKYYHEKSARETLLIFYLKKFELKGRSIYAKFKTEKMY